MKISLVANAYPPHFIGGAEIAAHRQALELIRQGHELSCFCGYSDPALPPYAAWREDVDGVSVTRVNVPAERFGPDQNFANVVVDSLFGDFLEKQAPDVVHFHNMPGLSLGMFDVCAQRALPSMVTFHDHWGFCLRNTLIRPGELRLCPDWTEHQACLASARYEGQRIPTFMRADYVRLKLHQAGVFHFPSAYLMSAYEAAHFDMARARRHTYGIEAHWFSPLPEVRRSGPIRVAFVAYLGRHKGPDVLMRAIEKLEAADLLQAFEFGIYGHGELQGELEAWVARRGWGERVRVHGKLENAQMQAVYRDADLMVNCSLWPENEPVTILEALASGTPVVASRIGGNIELVREGENGWCYAPGSVDELAGILSRIADDPVAVFDRREDARRSVADRTIDSYGRFALSTYAELKVATADDLPSIIAVACENFDSVNFDALWRTSKVGYWASAEWVPVEALKSDSELGAVAVLLSLDGRAPEQATVRLSPETPVVVLGDEVGSWIERFTRVTKVDDLTSLQELSRQWGEQVGGGERRA